MSEKVIIFICFLLSAFQTFACLEDKYEDFLESEHNTLSHYPAFFERENEVCSDCRDKINQSVEFEKIDVSDMLSIFDENQDTYSYLKLAYEVVKSKNPQYVEDFVCFLKDSLSKNKFRNAKITYSLHAVIAVSFIYQGGEFKLNIEKCVNDYFICLQNNGCDSKNFHKLEDIENIVNNEILGRKEISKDGIQIPD